MAFSDDIKIRVMVACGRRCCVCHKFCGNNMEVHHIKAHADGGADVFDNAIPLCFDCHAIVRQYDRKHPKGIKFTEKELIMHRDFWYKKIEQATIDRVNDEINQNTEPVQLHHQKIMLRKVREGKEIMSLMQGVCGISYDEEARTLEEAKIVGDFIQYIRELIDIDDLLEEPSDRIMTAFNLTEGIEELERIGFWVFVGIENRKLTGGKEKADNFPVLLMRIVKKENSEIIKTKPM